jgi:hypothetical protein
MEGKGRKECPDKREGMENSKSEGRRPKTEGNPKSETRFKTAAKKQKVQASGAGNPKGEGESFAVWRPESIFQLWVGGEAGFVHLPDDGAAVDEGNNQE